MMELKIREMTPQERLYCYSQSLELEIKTGGIGHLRANLGVDGENFYSSWTDH